MELVQPTELCNYLQSLRPLEDTTCVRISVRSYTKAGTRCTSGLKTCWSGKGDLLLELPRSLQLVGPRSWFRTHCTAHPGRARSHKESLLNAVSVFALVKVRHELQNELVLCPVHNELN